MVWQIRKALEYVTLEHSKSLFFFFEQKFLFQEMSGLFSEDEHDTEWVADSNSIEAMLLNLSRGAGGDCFRTRRVLFFSLFHSHTQAHSLIHTQTFQTKSIIKILHSTPLQWGQLVFQNILCPLLRPQSLTRREREKKLLNPRMEDGWLWINGCKNKWTLGESLYPSIQSSQEDDYLHSYIDAPYRLLGFTRCWIGADF